MKLRKVIVRWLDSGIAHSPAPLEDVATISEMESCGFLLKKTRKAITLGLDHSISFHQYRATICIPRVNVRSITYLKKCRGRKK